jgi:dTDP-4-amino-4,6-dideoxygalactose transaminase
MMKLAVSTPTLPPFEEYLNEIKDIWDSRILTHQGQKYQELEKRLADFLGVKNILLFANGHLSLLLALRALDISDGEVITTPFTFSSTTMAILEAGLTPVFCDVDPKTYTLDPERVRQSVTAKTKAILPVHVFGHPCDCDAIQQIATERHLKVIYDAAHAFGVSIDGAGIGAFGDISMFSFHATKVFNTVEGGALTFTDSAYLEKLKELRQYGQVGDSYPYVGTNAKMSEFHAAMGLCNLRHIDSYIEKRRLLSEQYREALLAIEGIRLLDFPATAKRNYAYYPVLIEPPFPSSRDEVTRRLNEDGVLARKYFSPLTSSFDCCQAISKVASTPVAKCIESPILCLPLHTEMNETDVQRIVEIIVSVY